MFLDKIKKSGKIFFKIVFSSILFFFAAQKQDLVLISSIIKNSEIYLLILSLILFISGVLVSSIRWSIVIRKLSNKNMLHEINKLNLISVFFNQILPSGSGGEVLKLWYMHNLGLNMLDAFSSIFLDKVFGLFVLAYVGFIGSCFYHANYINLSNYVNLLILMIVPILFQLLCFAAVRNISPETLCIFFRLEKNNHFALFYSKLVFVLQDNFTCILLILTSLYCSLTAVFGAYLIALSIGSKFSIASLMFVVSFTTLFSVLPISIGGWGIRENLFIVLLSSNKLEADYALAMSVLYGALHLLLALPGAFVWLRGRLVSRN